MRWIHQEILRFDGIRVDRAEVFAAMMTRQVPDDACSRAEARALALSLVALQPRLPAAVVAYLPAPTTCE